MDQLPGKPLFMPSQISSHQNETALEVLQQFRIIYGSMRQYFKDVEERCGLPGSHTWVLQEVERNPGIGVSELAKRMGIHQSTSSLLVEKLVELSYLKKSRLKADMRRVGLELRPLGKKALAALPGPAEGILPEALSLLPEVVLKTLNINLSELIEHLQKKDDTYANIPLADIVSPPSRKE